MLCLPFYNALPRVIFTCLHCRKKCRFSEIRDILGLRIILETEDDCSKEKEKVLCLEAKAVVQELWKMVPEFEKNYIDEPKDR